MVRAFSDKAAESPKQVEELAKRVPEVLIGGGRGGSKQLAMVPNNGQVLPQFTPAEGVAAAAVLKKFQQLVNKAGKVQGIGGGNQLEVVFEKLLVWSKTSEAALSAACVHSPICCSASKVRCEG